MTSITTPTPSTTSLIHAILLSGRSGVGKSSVAYEITHQLSQRGHPHVHIDGDNLAAIHPREAGPALMLANLTALWTNFYQLRKCRILLLSGTGMVLEHKAIRDVLESVSGEAVRLDGVVLTADDETAVERLKVREIGTDLERHLESSARMARVLDGFGGMKGVYRVKTDGRVVSDIAEEIIRVVFCL